MKDKQFKKILGISGSPRRGGNTETLLDRALEAAKNKGADVKKIVLNELKFSACQECENIRKDGSCIIKDDWQKVFSEIEKADAIILASPIFFGSVSAQTKMFIDRFQCLWLALNRTCSPACQILSGRGSGLAKNIFKTYKTNKKRVGVFICVEASERKDFLENAKSIVKNFFTTIGADYREELLCIGVDKKEGIKERPECLKKASEIGERIAI